MPIFFQEHLQKALDTREQLFGSQPNDDTASSLYNLGQLFHALGGRTNHEKAVNLHERCFKMYEDIGLRKYLSSL